MGQCYLTNTGHVRWVLRILPGKVQFESRLATTRPRKDLKLDVLDLRSFAFSVERPVPCDWTPGTDEA
jgi:hypothetical protein